MLLGGVLVLGNIGVLLKLVLVLGIVKAFLQNWYWYWVLLKPFAKLVLGIVKAFSKYWYWYWVLLRPQQNIGNSIGY